MTRSEYRQIVLAVKDRINTYAAWTLRDADEAADVTQDALLRLWERREDVRAGAARTWLYRTVYRLCVDRIRRRNGPGKTCSLEVGSIGSTGLVPADGWGLPAEAVGAADRKNGVARALSEMSPRDRAFLVLREFDGLCYERIGEVMLCSANNVKVGLHRARERLRKKLVAMAIQ